MELISSLQNPRVKNVIKLGKPRERQSQHVFIIEGARELMLAKAGGYLIKSVFICPELFAKSEYPHVLEDIPEERWIGVTLAVFEKISYRTGSDGLLALAEPKNHRLSDLSLSENPFLIVLEAIEKPGNLGAILRTADAAKVDGVIICDPATDIYNPNVIRSGVGCLFTVPVAVATSQETLDFLHLNSIKSYAAELEASSWYQDTDFTVPSAIIMGTEADGLTGFWLNNADGRIKIPMRGVIDSLNVSVSTAVITFEAMRQRRF